MLYDEEQGCELSRFIAHRIYVTLKKSFQNKQYISSTVYLKQKSC